MPSLPGPCGSSVAACCPDSCCTAGSDTAYMGAGGSKGEREKETHRQMAVVHVGSDWTRAIIIELH